MKSATSASTLERRYADRFQLPLAVGLLLLALEACIRGPAFASGQRKGKRIVNTVQRLLLSCALLWVAWTDSLRGQVVEGNRLFSEGKFSEAVESYGQALVDHPDSPLLNFNMGTAHYKAGKYAQALSSFSRVQAGSEDSDGDAERTARTAYNMGNAQYKMGAQAEEQNPQAALTAYTNALAAYRRALGVDPTDRDAKFNYEFVTQKIEALQEKLENQPEPEEQQQSEQEDNGQQQPDAPQNGQDRQHAGEQPEEPPRAEQGQDQPNEMSEDEAQSVLDTARNEELSPEEFARQAQRGGVAEALRDW